MATHSSILAWKLNKYIAHPKYILLHFLIKKKEKDLVLALNELTIYLWSHGYIKHITPKR